MKDDFLTNMQLVKEGKLICKQNKCRFYHNCDNYNCSYLEIAEERCKDYPNCACKKKLY